MENNNSIIGIKINKTNIPAKCIMIIKKYQDLSISEIKQKIEKNKYILTCDYIDDNGIKSVLGLYNELNAEEVNCSLYEHNNPTTIEFLNNLLNSYEETRKQVEEDIENEVQAEILEKVFKDYIKFSDVDEKLISQYEEKLPQKIIYIWKNYGLGTFYNGYLKIINPNEYKELIEKTYFQGNVSIPIFATAFGDIITWEKNQFIGIIKYRYGENDVISDGFDFFYEDLLDGEFDDTDFNIKKYKEALNKYGMLEYDECFGYVPLIAMGGKESVENIKKAKIKEHISLISNFIGKI
ncbi:putative uncharacterized protein [Clostridium sp. CAG:465]|nr:putative uncharacterized protein [Clostridium sp. CAG:465]